MRKLSKVEDMTMGLDVGDRFSHFAVLSAQGQIVEEGRVATSEAAFSKYFSSRPPMRIAIETGTHSPWISRLLAECGHEVIVANSRKLRLIYENPTKDDRVDARYLARLARFEPALLASDQWPGPPCTVRMFQMLDSDAPAALVPERTGRESETKPSEPAEGSPGA